MKMVTVHKAKTTLSKLLAAVEAGETVIIARGRKPVARLVPVDAPTTPRHPGTMRAAIKISPDFDAPLPDDLAEAFGAR
jgi:prevent-host-death family protein